MIALISKNTRKAEGAISEIKCAVGEKVPVPCAHIFEDDKALKPSVLAGTPLIE